ncbi:hypothetical protein CPC08DRAFT_385319 [Agrocybe pediades]|nr:hypothetical protein CPC08DRAFT_385319 [Agrocybe pediades]
MFTTLVHAWQPFEALSPHRILRTVHQFGLRMRSALSMATPCHASSFPGPTDTVDERITA